LYYCPNGGACDQSRLYVLERVGHDVNAKFTPSGLAEVSFITLEKSGNDWVVNRTTVKDLPFWALSQFFAPVTPVANDPDNCGYWMLPYDALDNLQRIHWGLLDNFRVVDLEIEFTETSYALHPNATDFNLTLLKNSTKPRNRQSFNGPLPFDLIY
jgi:hypothetical protein